MQCCSQGNVSSRSAKRRSTVWLLIAVNVVIHQFGWGQTQPPSIPPQREEWTWGPTNIAIGDHLEVTVPVGYAFGDARLAGRMLEISGNIVPSNLAGVLSQRNGLNAILAVTPMDHIKVGSVEPIDNTVAIQSLREIAKRQNRPGKVSLTSLDWTSLPSYEPGKQIVGWTLLVEASDKDGKTAKFQNRTVRVLGRRSVLDITIPFGMNPLMDGTVEEILSCVQFKTGEKYSDFQETEKWQPMTPTELAALDAEAVATQHAAAKGKWAMILWISIGSLAAVGSTLLVIKMRHARPAPRSVLSSQRDSDATALQPRQPIIAKNITQEQSAKTETFPISTHSKPSNGSGNGNANGNGNGKVVQPSNGLKTVKTNGQSPRLRQRRDFDYNRYFADLMSSVSGHLGNAPEGRPSNGSPKTNGTNGKGQNQPHNANLAGSSFLDVNSQMIENQRTLIEEQRRLIYEQTKLIEEKSKLIAEKNQLLDRQTELLENKLL